MMLETSFYNRDACKVATDLIGKVIRRRYKGLWLSAQIIETEAYYINEKGSHSSLGETPKRKAMFMPAVRTHSISALKAKVMPFY